MTFECASWAPRQPAGGSRWEAAPAVARPKVQSRNTSSNLALNRFCTWSSRNLNLNSPQNHLKTALEHHKQHVVVASAKRRSTIFSAWFDSRRTFASVASIVHCNSKCSSSRILPISSKFDTSPTWSNSRKSYSSRQSNGNNTCSSPNPARLQCIASPRSYSTSTKHSSKTNSEFSFDTST